MRSERQLKLYRRLVGRIAITLLVLLQFRGIAVCEELRFMVIDVGMAESMIVTCGSETMVIDTAYAMNEEAIREAMEQMETDGIKYLVLTHPHADHISGARWMIDSFDIDTAILPPIEYGSEVFGKTVESMIEHEIDLVYPRIGEQFTLGSAKVTVYGPHQVAYQQENNWSVVLMIEFAGRRILLTGDTQMEAERDMLSYDERLPLQADILKVAHHGSDTSSSFDFIQAVSPEYAIISCGQSDADHPHIETIMTLTDCGVKEILTTDQLGNIYVRILETGNYIVLGEKMQHFMLVK